jgi:hypothetical protein
VETRVVALAVAAHRATLACAVANAEEAAAAAAE